MSRQVQGHQAAERSCEAMRLTGKKKRKDAERPEKVAPESREDRENPGKGYAESGYVESRYDELHDAGRISARIIDVSSGLRAIEGVYAVRIHSADFTALIMNDYIPALGKIDGDVTFLSRDGEYPYHDIRGFYKHQHNEFTLLVEEHDAGSRRKDTSSETAEEDADGAGEYAEADFEEDAGEYTEEHTEEHIGTDIEEDTEPETDTEAEI